MSTFLEFNRDLFLCNTITSASETTNGKNTALPTFVEDTNHIVNIVNDYSDLYSGSTTQTQIYPILKTDNFSGTIAVTGENGKIKITNQTLGKKLFDDRLDNVSKYTTQLQKYINYDIFYGDLKVIKGCSDGSSPNNGVCNTGTLTYYIDGRYDPTVNYKLKKLESAKSCDTYDMYSKCDDDNDQSCEICKNFKIRDWYDENNDKQISFIENNKDAKSQYIRSWVQTLNLGIAILLLGYGIYVQNK
jgi:hypothetical protein